MLTGLYSIMSFSQYVGDEYDSYCLRMPLIGYMNLLNAYRQSIPKKLRRLIVGLGWVSLQSSPLGGSVTTSCMLHVLEDLLDNEL